MKVQCMLILVTVKMCSSIHTSSMDSFFTFNLPHPTPPEICSEISIELELTFDQCLYRRVSVYCYQDLLNNYEGGL